MSTTSHLDALERRHAAVDAEILKELQHAAKDDIKVNMLKRKKLELKDEIARLQKSTRQ